MKINKLVLLIIILSIIGTMLVYTSLPDIIPHHWNFKGEVDRSGSKSIVFFTAVLPLLIYFMKFIIPKVDPNKQSYVKHRKAYDISMLSILLFLVAIHWLVIIVALGYNVDIGVFVRIGIGVIFIIIGNYMTQIRHNYFFGIRTPWTLASEVVWKKTHRVGGYSFIILGLLFIITLILNDFVGLVLPILGIIIIVLGSFLYSYILYKKQKN